jgi:PAS domain S-box-containing protein
MQDLKKSKKIGAELDRLFDLSLDLLCIAGTDGYFKHVNPAFETVLGYKPDELLSRAFVEFVHPDDREQTLSVLQSQTEGLPVLDFQNRYLAKDGQYRWLAWRAAPPTGTGLIYAVARDITEQKEIEEFMVQQTEELRRSNADLEQFAYIASHDLQTPLRAIRNLSEWIEEDVPDTLPPAVKTHLEKLRNQVDRMESLIDDLLVYARVGQKTEQRSLVNTAELIEELTKLLAPPKGFSVIYEQELPVFETVQPPLEQVFRNLIANSIKHHDRSEGKIEISCTSENQFFRFTVTDDGPGIPLDSHGKVFMMFHKIGTEEGSSGTGIGLALVKRIVENHGGLVEIDPTPGRGTSMTFTWPKS